MSSDQRLATFEPGDKVIDDLAWDEAPSAPPTLWLRLSGNQNVAITLVALMVFGFFSLATDTFLTEFNLINILRIRRADRDRRGRHDLPADRRRDRPFGRLGIRLSHRGHGPSGRGA